MEEQKSKNKLLKVFAIIGVIVAVAGEDYEDDFEDDYEDEDEEE